MRAQHLSSRRMVVDSLRRGVELTCFSCGTAHDPLELQTVCNACGLPLEVHVPLPEGPPEQVIDRSRDSMWRYSAVLPIPSGAEVSLGEGWTPMTEVEEGVFVKDESMNPTTSFKDRGMSMAVSAAKALGARRVVAPSAGNAAVALSAYGREANLPVLVAMPSDTPLSIVMRCGELQADVQLVEGDISFAGRWLSDRSEEGDFDVSTLKEPYRVEGKKTMGYELFEQFGGELPEVVIYPTGGGTGLVGMWKAWSEMERLGWIGGERPRMVSVQSEGCAPIVKAHREGRDDIEPWPDPMTEAWGLRVPSPIGGFLCLRAIAETLGSAIAIPEEEIHDAALRASSQTGADFSPEGGAAWAAMRRLQAGGYLQHGERVVVWNTGAGASYR